MNRKQQQYTRAKYRKLIQVEQKYKPLFERALNRQVRAFLDYAEQITLPAAIQLIDSVVVDAPLLPVMQSLYVSEGAAAAKREERYLQDMYGKEYDQLRNRRRQKGMVITNGGQLKAFTFFPEWSRLFQNFFNSIGFQEVRRITETTRQWLRDRANELLGQDLTFPEIRDAIINESADINRKRANVIARTETITALNNGSSAAAKALPIKMSHTWIATDDNRTRHSHRRMDGETVPLEAPFSNGGMYPGDPNLIAKERIQCRCVELHNPVRDRNNMLIEK